MKRLIKILTIAFLSIGTFKTVNAQDADLTMSGGPNMGTYPGYVVSGTFNVTLNNPSTMSIPSGSFDIVITLPIGYFEFENTYPGIPSGFTYNKIDANVVHLVQSGALTNTLPASIVTFQVPFHTVTNTTVAQPWNAQIQKNIPNYNDPNDGNNTPSGTVNINNTPLPLEFISFDASVSNCTTKLNWTTGNEKNNDHFSVERSATGGNDFKSIGKVERATENTNGGKYSFEDVSPLKGKNFYRIRQVDKDGKSTTSKTQNVTIRCGNEKIDLFPNPTTNIINIKGLSGSNSIKILSAAGQEVLAVKSEKEIESISTSMLAAGAYNLQVIKEGEIIFTGKFMKTE